jgi:4-amino-4-deoxy-L-arabinose transferase-like glycosyltransferase
MPTLAPAGTRTAPQPGQQTVMRWEPWALTAVCVVAATLYLWGIGHSWGNTYYSAAVKSMSRSFENFVFGSLDGAGVVTVDKPPMALWLQVISSKIFGYNQFALAIPQAVAGVAAVFVLHRTVRRWAGEHAALLAALVLALTPITVMVNRVTNPDTLLVLLVVAGAYAMTRAFDGPRSTVWLSVAAFLVGCGFLTKMLQAWMVLPAFVAAYLIGRRASWRRRITELAMAGGVLVASSFWWVAATSLWPDPKPFIGGSTDGSAWDLVFGYNGFGRIFGESGNPSAGGLGGMGGFGGEPGVLRLFNDQVAGQISWLLPLCGLIMIVVAVAAVRRWRAGGRLDRHQAAGWVLWGGWLLVVGVMLSFAKGIMHPYYTTMMAPAVGALTGAGLVHFWRWHRTASGTKRLLLPLAIVLSVGWAFAVVARDLDWHPWAGYVALGTGIVAVGALVIRRRNVTLAGLALGLTAVLAVPGAWSVIGAVNSDDTFGGANPAAGPVGGMFGSGRGGLPGGLGALFPQGAGLPSQPTRPGSSTTPGSPVTPPPTGQPVQPGSGERPGAPGLPGTGGLPAGIPGFGGDGSLTDSQRALLDFVRSNAGALDVPLAVEGGAMAAAPYIIHSDLTVVGMGGFLGTDDAPSASRLMGLKKAGQLGFVQLGGRFGGMELPAGVELPGGMSEMMNQMNAAGNDRTAWVNQNCKLVQAGTTGLTAETTAQLYDCR